MRKRISYILIALMLAGTMTACSAADTSGDSSNTKEKVSEVQAESTEAETEEVDSVFGDDDSDNDAEDSSSNDTSDSSEADVTETVIAEANVTSTGMIDASDMFTDRDLEQTADTSEATYYTVKSGEDITITAAGVYVISGNAENVTIYVEAEDEDKVQIVLDGVNIANETAPVIYVKSADKVFVTTASS